MQHPPDYSAFLKNAFRAAVPNILATQEALRAQTRVDGNGQPLIATKADGTLVTPADTGAQAALIASLTSALGGTDNVCVVAEEKGFDPGDPARANYRLIIDPLDGTTNFTQLGSNNASALDARGDWQAATRLPDGLRGWGSMVAIQRKGANGQWATVAAGVYESSPQDRAGYAAGNLYLADERQEGIRVTTLGEDRAHLLLHPRQPLAGVAASGGSFWPEDEIMLGTSLHSDHHLNFGCTAQGALAALRGKLPAFFQGHTSLHDSAAVAYLGQKSGLPTVMLPPIARDASQPGQPPAKDQNDALVYPMLIASDPEMACDFTLRYLAAKGYDPQQVTLMRGDFSPIPLADWLAEHNRVSAPASILAGWRTAVQPAPKNSDLLQQINGTVADTWQNMVHALDPTAIARVR